MQYFYYIILDIIFRIFILINHYMVLEVIQVKLVQLVLQEYKVQLENRGLEETLELLEKRDIQVFKVYKVIQVFKAYKVIQVCRE
ncbi:MAG: hypothetical protein EBV73_08205 [Rhodocyclales bacterium]|nr:hypothetical protein [Rhodocyclales bacterium]